MTELVGNLTAHFETGSEGIIWAFEEAGKEGYDGFHSITNDSVLTVFNDAARTDVLWQGEINLNYERDISVKQIVGLTQPVQCQLIGLTTVNGLPDNCDEQSWLKMFKSEKPAILEKKQERITIDISDNDPLLLQ